jgi:hypothetical protein
MKTKVSIGSQYVAITVRHHPAKKTYTLAFILAVGRL